MSVLNVYPTRLTDEFLRVQHQEFYAHAFGSPHEEITRLCRTMERDCMALAMRLYGENPDTFAPETAEVMDRWRPRIFKLLEQEKI